MIPDHNASRRFFLATASAGAAGAALGALGSARESSAQAREAVELPRPTRAQLAWQDFELGLVYHFDLDVYTPGGHDHEQSRRVTLDASLYNPRKLDTDQWLEAARVMGAKYAIFTATHHQGFLQWQSDLYPFGLKQVKWRGGKGDIVLDFVESCHRYGIRPGLYVGTRFNAYWQVYNFKVNGGKGGDPQKQAAYDRVALRMVEELVSRYGELAELWFDGGERSPEQGGPDYLSVVRRYQPSIVYYHTDQLREHRWAGNENGVVGYPCWSTMRAMTSWSTLTGRSLEGRFQGDPDGKIWMPAMADAPIRDHDWLWVPNREHRLQPLDKLVDMYYRSVGHNANLVLGAVPDQDGLIPQPDMQRYAQFGRELKRRFGKALGRTSGIGEVIELTLAKPARIDHVIIMEDIAEGERVREYVVEGFTPDAGWVTIADGVSIGHKRIQRFDPVHLARLRLRVTKSVATPRIRDLSVYSVRTT